MSFKFVEELCSKKDFEEKMLNKFNKWWYSDGEEIIITWVKDNMYNNTDTVLFPFCQLTIHYKIIDIAYHYKFLRSKLWNMGINLLSDSYCNLFVKIRENEKYSDCFCYFFDNIIPTTEHLIFLSIFSGLSFDEIKKRFSDSIPLSSKNNSNLSEISKNKRKRKSDNVKKSNDTKNDTKNDTSSMTDEKFKSAVESYKKDFDKKCKYEELDKIYQKLNKDSSDGNIDNHSESFEHLIDEMNDKYFNNVSDNNDGDII